MARYDCSVARHKAIRVPLSVGLQATIYGSDSRYGPGVDLSRHGQSFMLSERELAALVNERRAFMEENADTPSATSDGDRSP